MITAFLEKLQRRYQLSKLKTNPKIKFSALKLGTNNHFAINPNIKNLHLGANVSFRNYVHILVEKEATLYIGDKVFMNNFCSINCLDNIYIGENTLFGENVKLYDHNHLFTKHKPFEISHQEFSTAPIHIGKNCWLGSNVTVLKGVTIGDNTIIGAGCVIHKNIPENSIVVNSQELTIKPR